MHHLHLLGGVGAAPLPSRASAPAAGRPYGQQAAAGQLPRLLVATDAFAMVDQRVRDTLHAAIARVSAVVGATREVTVSVEGLQE